MRHVPFVHLRCTTEYSLLACTNRVDPLLQQAVDYRLPALAITDAGNLFGAVPFYQRAVAHGIKPILGSLVYLAPGDRHTPPRGTLDETSEILLLVRNDAGWRSLIRLLSAAHLESMFHRPQVDWELLAEHGEGLICLTGARQGLLPQLLEAGDTAGATAALGKLRDIYGPDNVFVEITENRVPGRQAVKLALIELAHGAAAPLVATAENPYLKPDDTRAHDALVCIGTGRLLDEEDRPRLPEGAFHFRSPEDMAADFAQVPDALENTVRIAQRCNLDLRFDTPYMPQFPLPEGQSAEHYLADQVAAGLARRLDAAHIPLADRATYQARAEWELSIIDRMGYPGYFLIVWDIIRFAREADIPVGPGRGSAAGSLVAYSLGITDIDPLPYNLLFERFLNPERVSLPDIDMDFCMEHRDRVIHYVAETYGTEHVCQIITFGTMGAKAVLRDVARVLGFSYGDSDRIAKLVPTTLGMTLKKALKEEPQLAEAVASDPRVAELMTIARSLEGVSRHASTHAAGVIISAAPLTDHTPLYRGPGGETISHFAKDEAEAVGLVKFDLLGLKTLTVIDHAVREIARAGVQLDMSQLTLDDPDTYALLARGDTTGVFQLESPGMRDLIVKMRPTCFEDLVALLALYRPGPIGSGMLDDFVGRKKGTIPIVYDLPELAPILSETYGVIVYQEQVMRIANVVAGYSLGEADLLRRAMGKKKASEMEKQKTRFIAGATDLGHSAQVAERLFDLMAYFAGYGFNKSHSAAYAVISFQTAYLKAHHPVPFMAALLTNDMGNPDKTAKNIAECRQMGIPILPPDVNISAIRFHGEALPNPPADTDAPPDTPTYTPTPNGNGNGAKPTPAQPVFHEGVRYGLGGIKGAGESALAEIIHQRTESPLTDLHDLCRRVDLNRCNKRVLEALVAAGAMDGWGPRAAQWNALELAMEVGGRVRREREAGQESLFGDALNLPATAIVGNEWDAHERLTHEKDALGFYLSDHPMSRYRNDARRYTNTTLAQLTELPNGREVRVAAMLSGVRGRITKKGDRMAFLMVEDETTSVEVIAFPDIFKDAEPLLQSDARLLITGTVDVSDSGGAAGVTKLKATRIEDLMAVRRQKSRQVTFRFTSTGLTTADLTSLREVLGRHPGACRVRLQVHVPGVVEATLAADPELRVAADDALVREAERVLGHGSVAFA